MRFYDCLAGEASFLEDCLRGLSAPQKALSPKYFYDHVGSQLFEEICALPEYYPTRTEMAIMEASVAEVARMVGPDTELIELGSGASVKTRLLIAQTRPALYVPIDIAERQLRSAADEIAALFPWLNICAVRADFTRPLRLPSFIGFPFKLRVVYFPGSTIGNFTPGEAVALLRGVRDLAGTGARLLIGVDLKKDKRMLEAAYDDAQGVTARFNLNLLARINRELGGDFRPERFRHKAFYDEALGRIEMHLESRYAQFVHLGGRRFDFRPGETIHTEISCKYSVEEFQALARRARFEPLHVWTDADRLFAVHLLIAV
ncbi:MAG: L-histidine N(alpha)-methyltransferase [Burkholderiales bacterium]|nr:L-histidine N(alpha)-methyltransferase [Burkholderiales bacterium]